MPRYMVERTFPEGLGLPANEQGARPVPRDPQQPRGRRHVDPLVRDPGPQENLLRLRRPRRPRPSAGREEERPAGGQHPGGPGPRSLLSSATGIFVSSVVRVPCSIWQNIGFASPFSAPCPPHSRPTTRRSASPAGPRTPTSRAPTRSCCARTSVTTSRRTRSATRRIREAYETLSDPDRREAYDRTLVVKKTQTGGAPGRRLGRRHAGRDRRGRAVPQPDRRAGAHRREARAASWAPRPRARWARAQHRGLRQGRGTGLAFAIGEERDGHHLRRPRSRARRSWSSMPSRNAPARAHRDRPGERPVQARDRRRRRLAAAAQRRRRARRARRSMRRARRPAGTILLAEGTVQGVRDHPKGRVIDSTLDLAAACRGAGRCSTRAGRVVGVAAAVEPNGRRAPRANSRRWTQPRRSSSGRRRATSSRWPIPRPRNSTEQPEAGQAQGREVAGPDVGRAQGGAAQGVPPRPQPAARSLRRIIGGWTESHPTTASPTAPATCARPFAASRSARAGDADRRRARRQRRTPSAAATSARRRSR